MGTDRAEGARLRISLSRIVILALVGMGVTGALALRERRASGPTATPAIVIDERVVHARGIPTKAEIEQWVREFHA